MLIQKCQVICTWRLCWPRLQSLIFLMISMSICFPASWVRSSHLCFRVSKGWALLCLHVVNLHHNCYCVCNNSKYFMCCTWPPTKEHQTTFVWNIYFSFAALYWDLEDKRTQGMNCVEKKLHQMFWVFCFFFPNINQRNLFGMTHGLRKPIATMRRKSLP